ncbi:hypothetical protein NP493_138g05008 [Ridgeia piscesae]|uniref:Ras-associating domain-containing protein n=1 Tax=Ridgeia piscesae TaxID=27915 RepID=A0AAD9P508_RIDPI|nr:hypothetical protein NP493_138g05008 [Ridgeia piscesae]
MDQFGYSGSGSGSGSSGDDFEIPVWFCSDEKWITGVTKRTTCDDVIYALLCQDGGDGGDGGCVSDDIGSYAVFERWRGVERPLTGRTKLLKVWRAWGMEGSSNGVRFYVRRLDERSALDSSCESIRPRRSARRHHHHNNDDRTQSSSSRHHRQRDFDSAARRRENEKTRAFHRLVQLVIEQEKDIQRQLEHMRDTDAQIEHFETKVHVARLAENGQNYVQDAYLRDVSDESATSGDELFPAVKAADIEAYLRICEHIINLEDCLSTEEGKIGDLSRQIQEQSLCEAKEGRVPAPSVVVTEPADDQLRLEMVRLRDELHRCMALSHEQSAQVDHVNRLFAEYDQQVEQRHALLDDLLWQVEMAEAADAQTSPEVGENREYDNGVTDETKDVSSGIESGSADSNELPDIDTPKMSDIKRSNSNRYNQHLQSQHEQYRQYDTYELPQKQQPELRRPPSWISPSGDYNDIGGKLAPSSTVSFESTVPETPITSTPGCYTTMVPYCTYNTYGTYDEQTDVVSANKLNASEDTNSDTGLSSMHSDEQITILETLV